MIQLSHLDGEVRSGERRMGRLLVVDEQGRAMEPEDYRIVQGHLDAAGYGEDADGRRARVEDAIMLIVNSPDYLIQR